LLNVDLSEIASFDDLHERVESAIGRIKGIGPLTIYDIAHRLGVYLGVRPKDVYLHCGTREGAKALGLDYTAEKLAVSDLPAPLHALQPDQIEDCLCIFKDDIRRLRRATDPQD